MVDNFRFYIDHKFKEIEEQEGLKVELDFECKVERRVKEMGKALVIAKKEKDEEKEQAILKVVEIFVRLKKIYCEIYELNVINFKYPNSHLRHLGEYIEDELDIFERFLCASTTAIAKNEKIDDFVIKLVREE